MKDLGTVLPTRTLSF